MKKESLGQIFKRYREAERIKIEQVEKETKISKRMILAMESDDYEILPDDLYVKNLIKTYAQYLELDYNKLLPLYEKAKNFQPKKQSAGKQFKVYITPQMIRNILIVIVVIFLLGYLGFQVKGIFTPPNLIVLSPEKNLALEQN